MQENNETTNPATEPTDQTKVEASATEGEQQPITDAAPATDAPAADPAPTSDGGTDAA